MNRSDVALGIRYAVDSDLPALAHHRVSMFREMGTILPGSEPALRDAATVGLREAMAASEYVGWLVYPATQPRLIVAGAGVLVRRLLPRPADHGTGVVRGREGIVLNMYVEPDYRRRGIARMLMDTIIAWAREGHVARLVLHASDEGRPLYASMGFVPTSEMRFTGSLESGRQGSQ